MNSLPDQHKYGYEIIKDLYKNKIILTWYRDNPNGWKLHSGLWSPFYIQLRELIAFPNILDKISLYIGKLIKTNIPNANLIIGLAMAGIPIATAVSLKTKIPAAYTRKLEGITNLSSLEKTIHKYGDHSLVEGRLSNNNRTVLVDDLVTQFTSKAMAISMIKHEYNKRKIIDYKVKDVVVLLDREQGAEKEAKKLDVILHSLIPFKSKGIHWLKNDLNPIEYNIITEYLDNPNIFQTNSIQADIAQKNKYTIT